MDEETITEAIQLIGAPGQHKEIYLQFLCILSSMMTANDLIKELKKKSGIIAPDWLTLTTASQLCEHLPRVLFQDGALDNNGVFTVSADSQSE